ncbi:MBL fold metallo-hydrolase [Roseicella aerolata]|uniref:MBL fold metallo-hydrolase n=1 Tax=Roseicella aerolata TaxID=2883479 RepID=A0A9X1L6A2_9PROT|nr:MBL fold metallo-hydrolase [Roseicella aerolata]MCB4820616.1 MBL fold metallo-hydrolase [Roseicella aerolata]
MTALATADGVEVLVLVDNVTDSLSSTPAFVTREWQVLRRRGMKVVAGGALCCANHGLSLVITAHGPDGRRSLLFDGGPVDYAVERNGTRLGVDFGAIGAAMLSHGHWDHAGGLPQALSMIRAANGGGPVPLHLHPGMFAERGSRQPDGGVLPMDRVPPPEAWTAMGAAPVLRADAYTILDDLFWISGEIPRRTPYERGLANQVARATEADPWRPDPLLLDERCLVLRIRDKGLLVFSACSHAGIANVLHHVRDSFPGEPIHAAMGGFHLSGENEAIIPETVRDLAGFGLTHIIPAHCTGWRAVAALERAFGEPAVAPAAVGKLYRL